MTHNPVRSLLWGVGASLVILGCVVLAARYVIPFATAIPVFMLLTMLVAWRGGFGASLAVAITATLAMDFFLTEPRYSLEMASPRDVLTLLIFAASSTLVSRLSYRIKSNSKLLHRSEEQQRLLYQFSRDALLVDWRQDVEEQLCHMILGDFRLKGVAIWTTDGAYTAGDVDAGTASERMEAAYRAQRNYDLPNESESLRVLRFGTRPTGTLLLRGEDLDPAGADALATLVATHIERIRSMRSEVRAQSQTLSERLRTAVLDGLAHAVKTPLTTIIVSSSGLHEVGDLTPLQVELAQVIESQANYLADLTNKLMSTAKLDNSEVAVRPRLANMEEIYSSVLNELRTAYDVSRIHSQGIPDAPLSIDPDLMRMILVQVLENALKYGADASPVSFKVDASDGEIRISVHNSGSYIPPAEQALIFERYYRGLSTQHKASGTGIGLSVAKRAVEAQGGRIWAESSFGSGTTFFITLPC